MRCGFVPRIVSAYSVSREAMMLVWYCTSSAGRENHFSIERFINPYENRNRKITGPSDSSSAPSTMAA